MDSVREAVIDHAGKVVEIEDPITLDSAPPAVKAEIIKQAAQGKLLQVTSVTKDNVMTFRRVHAQMHEWFKSIAKDLA